MTFILTFLISFENKINMNEFIFKIPLKLEELTLVTNDVQRFVVSQEYSQREVVHYFNGKVNCNYILT